MDKIETPEEFLASKLAHNQVIGERGTIVYKEGGKERMIQAIASRDALIRADERQKAAGRAIAYLWPDAPDFEPQPNELRAAIMADPKETTR